MSVFILIDHFSLEVRIDHLHSSCTYLQSYHLHDPCVHDPLLKDPSFFVGGLSQRQLIDSLEVRSYQVEPVRSIFSNQPADQVTR